MIDGCGRTIEYLRLSITERCNLSCGYCNNGKELCKPNGSFLSPSEMITAVSATASLGIKKVRITGGEPLVNPDVITICNGISDIPGIAEVGLTTNGIFLARFAKDLKAAGVKTINISLDTLEEETYRQITGGGRLSDVLEGIESALDADFNRIKINAVLLGGINDNEEAIRQLAKLSKDNRLDVRFIELMPMVEPKEAVGTYVPARKMKEVLNLIGEPITEGVCEYYQMPYCKGRIGLITPISNPFCESCNKIRITADGMIKPCLHSDLEFGIKGRGEEEMMEIIKEAILQKPVSHALHNHGCSEAGRAMNAIGG